MPTFRSFNSGGSIRLLRFCLACTASALLFENRFETYSSLSAFLVLCWAEICDGWVICQDERSKSGASGKNAFLLLLTISMLELATFLLWYSCLL